MKPARIRQAAVLLLLGLLGLATLAGRLPDLVALSAAREGTLTILWGDPTPGDPTPPRTHYYLTGDDGRATRLLIEDDTAELLALNGRRVIVAAQPAGDPASPDSGEPLLHATAIRPADAAVAPGAGSSAALVEGSRPFITLLCGFSDMAAPFKPLTYYDGIYGSDYPLLDHYWSDVSYGWVNVQGSSAAGPFAMPKARDAYLSAKGEPRLDQLADDCLAAADADVDYQAYDGINMVFNGDIGCCAWGGSRLMTLDGQRRPWRMTWLPPWAANTLSVFAHEMGHAFGLPHSSGDYDETYDSPWDVMSRDRYNCNANRDPVYSCIPQGTISYHKDLLGWIPAARRYAHAGGQQTITLDPLGDPPGDNYLIARIPINGSSTHFYTVEARRKAGYDVKLPGAGIVIHEVITNRDRPARVVDPDLDGDPADAAALWTVGETFAGLDHVVVSVDAQLGNSYVVTISNIAPSPWTGAAVGPGASGDLDDDDGIITMSAAAGDIFDAADSFFYAHQSAAGAMTLTTRVTAWDAAGAGSAKAGLMVRGSMSADAPHFTAHLTGPNNIVKLKWRDAAGQTTSSADGAAVSLPVWLKVIKTGRAFAGFYSADGRAWTQIAAPVTLGGFPESYRYGMAATSNDPGQTVTVTFADTTAAQPAGAAIGQGAAGSAAEAGELVTLSATGGDILKKNDSLFFYYLPADGPDLDVRVRLAGWDTNGTKTAKAGLMLRASTAADAPEFTIHVTGASRAIKLKYRANAGGTTTNVGGPDVAPLPVWLRLLKTEDVVQAFYSTDGVYYEAVGAPQVMKNLGEEYLYGLAATSNAPGEYVTATFRDLRVGPLPVPPPPTPTPTATQSPTPKPSSTPTSSPTPTRELPPTPSRTPSVAPSPTPTHTLTPPQTPTATHTRGPSPTSTHQPTPTGTRALTMTPTTSPTATRPALRPYEAYLPVLFVRQ